MNFYDCQLLVVKSKGSGAKITLYEFDKNGFGKILLHEINGYVGKNGVSKHKIEGDNCTPYGLYTIDFAFGTENLPSFDSKFPYRQITPYSCWINNSNSDNYNTWQEQEKFSDCEHLIDYPDEYKLAFAIGYNTKPVVKNKGSAIFFHCGNRETSGCICSSYENVVNIFHKLVNNKAIYIFIM